MKLKHITGAVLLLLVLAGLGIFKYVSANGAGPLVGATPSNGDFIGIYNATPTDLGLRDGYGSALATDMNGRLILSPSSTGLTQTLQQVTTAGAVTTDVITVGGLISTGSNTSTFAGVVSSTQFLAAIGTAAAPSFAFSGNSNSGMYIDGSGTLSWSTAGVLRMTLTSSALRISQALQPLGDNTIDLGSLATRFNDGFFGGVVSSTQFYSALGTAVAPAFGYNALATGMFFPSSNILGFTVQGVEKARLQAGSLTLASTVGLLPTVDNSADIGSLGVRFQNGYFGGTVSSGFLRASSTAASEADAVSVSRTSAFSATSTFAGYVSADRVAVGDGSATYPGLLFKSGTNYGIYKSGGTLVMLTGGTGVMSFSSSQVALSAPLVPNGDAIRNFGSNTARWANGFFAGTVSSTASIVNSGTSATSTATVGSNISPACDVKGDSDGAGLTFCTYLNGVQSCSATDCR